MEKDVRQFINEELGLTNSDILDLEVRFAASSLQYGGNDRYLTIVYYKDEPTSDYGYSWNKEGEIEPAYIGNGKHNPKQHIYK